MDKNRFETQMEVVNLDPTVHPIQSLFSIDDLKWLMEQAEKVERYEKALDDIKNLSTLNEYADANINGLLNACYQVASKVKPTIL